MTTQDDMFDFINDCDYIVEEDEIEIKPVSVVKKPNIYEKENILDDSIRNALKYEKIFNSEEMYKIFSEPINTTNTMEGQFSNVRFMEAELINLVNPNEDIIEYKCNFGEKRYPLYTPYKKERKSNRGRKPKPKPIKTRKQQGDGSSFNSQMTCVVRSSNIKVNEDKSIPYGCQIYKFKVFRTGKIQLPGVQQNALDDILVCSNKIAQTLNKALKPKQEIKLVSMSPVMKNYKFMINIKSRQIVNLPMMKTIISCIKYKNIEKLMQLSGKNIDIPEHPSIFMIKYSRQDTKMSSKFITPTNKKKDKTTRVNIFMRGRINILGALNTQITKKICDLLYWIFITFWEKLIVVEGK